MGRILLATASLETGHSVRLLREWIKCGWLPFTVAPGTVKTALVDLDDVKLAALRSESLCGVHRIGGGRVRRSSLPELRDHTGLSTAVLRRWLFDHGVAIPVGSRQANYLPSNVVEAFDLEHKEATGKLKGFYPDADPSPWRIKLR